MIGAQCSENEWLGIRLAKGIEVNIQNLIIFVLHKVHARGYESND